MPGFTAPGILFLNTWDAPERAFCRAVFERLRSNGYDRYVEPCAGAFTMPMVAREAGWHPRQMDTSDVGLYSSIVGTLLAGDDFAKLAVAVDGELVEIPDVEPTQQAAHLLYVQLLTRMEAKPKVDYWLNMVDDLRMHEAEHRDSIAERLRAQLDRIGGLSYRPLDMWTHLREVADDPKTVINANPPTFKGGFERFFDTKGRLTWAEPEYDVFDPIEDTKRMHAEMKDKPAMLLYLQQRAPGEYTDTPIFGRHLSPGQYVYLNSNRPDEIFEITGGPKVAPRRSPALSPLDIPFLPPDYEITPQSEIEVIPIKSGEADYYRGLWLHRLNAEPGPGNGLVVVDGHAAGVLGLSTSPMTARFADKWADHLLLRFSIGAPHMELRLTRLATMLALQRNVAEIALGEKAQIYVAASVGLVTAENTRYPESKGMRGLMKLQDRLRGGGVGKTTHHADGYRLIYSAEWQDKQPSEVLREFLRKEEQWRKNRSK